MSTAEAYPPRRGSAEPPPEALALRLDALAQMVERLEARVALLEGATIQEPTTPDRPVSARTALEVALPPTELPAAELPAADLPSPVRLMGLIGRTCLILGGATFIRALVDAGTIHRGWGVALGLAYGITWALLADRAKHPLDSAFHALASVLIVYPLIVESTARFGILEPGLSAFLLLTVTSIHAVVAWRRDLKPIIWTATLVSIGSGLVMMSARRSIEPYLAVFLILGAAALWATYGRRWHGLRWPTALAANLGVFILTSLAAWPGGIPEAYKGITPGRAISFALALALIYIGSFAVRMLQQRRLVNAFEITQTVLVLLVGFGGACRVALASGSGVGLLGAGITTAGLGCYATALPFAEDREEIRVNFQFFTFLAQTFLLLGGLIALPMPIFAPICGALGLGAMVAGLRLRRIVLIIQSSLYLLAAALTSGLATWTLRAFLAPAGPDSALPQSAILSLGCLAFSLVGFLLRRPEARILARVRPLILFLGTMTAGGLSALVVQVSFRGLTSSTPDPSVLAVLRTGVLSMLILALAWCGRKLPVLDLKWLVYPVMIVTALKFLFEDLAVGRPLTLFLGFMCYGATLMLAPRLLKAPVIPDRNPNANALKPEVDP